jgi:hypothetical protein
VLGLLGSDEGKHRQRCLPSAAKKAAAFFKDLALLGQDLDLASQPAQLLALVLLRPSALPSSTSLWATQFRSDWIGPISSKQTTGPSAGFN